MKCWKAVNSSYAISFSGLCQSSVPISVSVSLPLSLQFVQLVQLVPCLDSALVTRSAGQHLPSWIRRLIPRGYRSGRAKGNSPPWARAEQAVNYINIYIHFFIRKRSSWLPKSLAFKPKKALKSTCVISKTCYYLKLVGSVSLKGNIVIEFQINHN